VKRLLRGMLLAIGLIYAGLLVYAAFLSDGVIFQPHASSYKDTAEIVKLASANGKKMATLQEVVDPETPTMNLSQLSDKQRLALVAKRIEMQPDFQIAMLGAGLIDKKRALQEVKNGTPIGRNLAEIEERLLNHVIETAKKKSP